MFGIESAGLGTALFIALWVILVFVVGPKLGLGGG